MRRRLPDLAIVALLLLLPLIAFWPQTVGGYTLLPTENLYQYEPYASYRTAVGAPEIPHNHLLSDLVLQNMQFRSFAREQLAQGDFPLWNPHNFSGVAFFAAGQHAVLYPFSALFYLLDLPAAYGWYTVLQLWLAGAFMYALVRGLGVNRFGGAVAGITYQLSGFFVISAVFPMIIGAAVWLPLILLMIELIVRGQPALRGRSGAPLWAAIGAGALGCNILAGHVEITYYTLLIAAFYAAARLAMHLRAEPLRRLIGRGAWLLALVVLGLALGAVQFIPVFEAASGNFRVGSAAFDEVLGWAHPLRDLIQFAMPNFYGSPAHHAYFDVFSGQMTPVTINALGQPVTHTEWGIKNYVEGALYVGILPLALAIYALLPLRQRAGGVHWVFAALGLLALTFMFGLPTYALLYYTLPGIDQLHSPFRWVYALTLSVAVLAGFGAQRLTPALGSREVVDVNAASRAARWARRLGTVIGLAGLLIVGGLLVSRLLYPQIAPLVQRIFEGLAGAPERFADARMFYSYQFTNVLIFAGMLIGVGLVFRLSQPALAPARWLVGWAGPSGGLHRLRCAWQIGGLALVALDLLIASWGFNPASDPALLDFTPPAIEWLRDQPGDGRFITLETPGRPAILNANLGLRYGLDDVRGYESIIPRQYVDYMMQIAPQNQLEFNRIAPLWTTDDYNAILSQAQIDDLHLRYVVTYRDQTIDAPGWTLVYDDQAVRIYENIEVKPFAYTAADGASAAWSWLSARELLIDVEAEAGDQLVISQSYAPGWRAFIRPLGAGDEAEQAVAVERVAGNFQSVRLPDAGSWTVRLVYSPTSFQVGAFVSFIGAALAALLSGVWLWRLYVVVPAGEQGGAARVAKNSVAPIVLNLFNRGIDFAFAAVMLRLLGPALAGNYYYAIIIFGWFDIFTNFGLNLYLTREVARDRTAARRVFMHTSALRLLLALAGVPLLIGFLALRQMTGGDALPAEVITAIVLLYVGLIPNSLSTGLTALYYAFEQAEIPAAVTTVATILKAIFGLAVLLAGLSIVGLAGASILTNLVTLAILLAYARRMLAQPTPAHARGIDGGVLRRMIGESYPLMLNHFLASIFFKIDIVLIEFIHTARMVGQYSVAYKWVEALNIIPSFFTQALLPVMARQAHEDRASLLRTYTLAIKLLVIVALPAAVFFTFTAEALTQALGGAEFLPDGAIALQLMIWSIPIGWMNSLTQYVLIALDLQRRITWAFVIGVAFNLITNLIFIPTYGYQAAALTTIASEAVLWIAFGWLLRRSVGRIDWLTILWKPAVMAVGMLAVLLLAWGWMPTAALVGAALVYGLGLYALRPLNAEEWSRLTPLLPARVRQRMSRAAA